MEHMIGVCDLEEHYALRLAMQIGEKLNSPYEVYTFTNIDSILQYVEQNALELLVISESAYDAVLNNDRIGHLIVLREEGRVRGEKIHLIDRYQSADYIVRAVMNYMAEVLMPKTEEKFLLPTAKLIGFYSPIKRCLQSSLAMQLGKQLAENHGVLYLSFEYYPGMHQREDGGKNDLMDLLYYFDCDPDKIPLKISTLIQKIENMDHLPAVPGFELSLRTAESWSRFLELMERLEQYDFIILDLSESVMGLPEILKRCTRIYTITRMDAVSACKLAMYETWLVDHGYADIVKKTMKLHLPQFELQSENVDIGHLLNPYVSAMIREDEALGNSVTRTVSA